MTKSDKINNLENIVTKLFLQSLSIEHSYYYTNQRKINLFAEFYIYSHFFYEFIYYKKKPFSVAYLEAKDKLDKLNKMTITSSKNIDEIKETVNQLFNSFECHRKERNDVIMSRNETYSKLTKAIIRKLKIKMITK